MFLGADKTINQAIHQFIHPITFYDWAKKLHRVKSLFNLAAVTVVLTNKISPVNLGIMLVYTVNFG